MIEMNSVIILIFMPMNATQIIKFSHIISFEPRFAKYISYMLSTDMLGCIA